MNISWGYKITLLYSSFAAFIFIMVYKSSFLKTELVHDNYYQAEIHYQDRIDQMRNSRALAEPVTVKYIAAEDRIAVDMPDLGVDMNGTFMLYRPSDSKMDKTLAIALKPGEDFQASTAGLASGLWRVEIEWEAAGTPYYNEEVVILK